jgi:hypothetical protein
MATHATGKLSPRTSEIYCGTLLIPLPAFLHSSDPDGNHGFFNRHWFEYLGVSEDDLQGWAQVNLQKRRYKNVSQAVRIQPARSGN